MSDAFILYFLGALLSKDSSSASQIMGILVQDSCRSILELYSCKEQWDFFLRVVINPYMSSVFLFFISTVSRAQMKLSSCFNRVD